MINLAQPMIQSMHSLPVVKQVLSNMLLQIFISEGFSAIFCLQVTMMANAPRAIDLLADAMASAAQSSTTAPSTFAASRDRALRVLGDYIPGTPAHRAKWLNASTLLTGLQAFQVAKARGVLGPPHQVCIHVMGELNEDFITDASLYKHLFTISPTLKFIRLALISPEREDDSTRNVPVEGE